MKKKLPITILAACAICSCSAPPSDNSERPTAAAGFIEYADARGFTDVHAKSIFKTILSAVDGSLPLATVKVLGQKPEINASLLKIQTCEGTITYGGEVDDDEDKIPNLLHKTFACQTAGDESLTVTGNLSLIDKEPLIKFQGFRIKVNDYRYEWRDATEQVTQLTSGEFTNDFVNGTYISKHTLATAHATNSNGVETSMESGSYIDSTYTPLAAEETDPFLNGIINEVFGFYHTAEKNDDTAADYTIELAGRNLVYSGASCESFFAGGELLLRDEADNHLRVSFSNCVAAWTYNGQPFKQ